MGCFQSNHYVPTVDVTISSEEKYFIRETLLRYQHVQAEQIFAASVSYSSLQNKLTKPKLKQLMAVVGLESRGLETTDAPIRHFYMKLMKNQLYDCRKVKLLGILLSQGSAANKAKLVFNEFDGNGSKTLDLEEVTSMVSMLCTIAMVYLPQFSIEMAKDAKKTTDLPTMLAYADKLQKLLPHTSTYLAGSIVNSGSIAFSDFQRKVSTGDANVLCNAAILRSFAIDFETKMAKASLATDEDMPATRSSKKKPTKA